MMAQFFFFALLIITFFAGIFAYFAPKERSINPLKTAMEGSGYSAMVQSNTKRSQLIKMMTTNGLLEMRKQMDNITQKQNKFMEMIQDQQDAINNTNKDAYDILQAAEQEGEKGSNDLLQIKALAAQMQDEQRLLVNKGKDLIALNDQLTQSRQWIADQIDLANVNTQSSLGTLQQHYATLTDQAAGFFDKVSQHNQDVRDQMGKVQEQIDDLGNKAEYRCTAQQQSTKEHIQQILDKEHEDMLELADKEEKNKNNLIDAQNKTADSQQLMKDSQQRSQDLIDDEHQKAQDQQEMIQQRMADERQRIQDRQNQ